MALPTSEELAEFKRRGGSQTAEGRAYQRQWMAGRDRVRPAAPKKKKKSALKRLATWMRRMREGETVRTKDISGGLERAALTPEEIQRLKTGR